MLNSFWVSWVRWASGREHSWPLVLAFQQFSCGIERITISSIESVSLHEDIFPFKVMSPWGFEGLPNSEYFT